MDSIFLTHQRIHRIHESDSTFLVTFAQLASRYRTDDDTLRQVIRMAHDKDRDISFLSDAGCNILSVTPEPPSGLLTRLNETIWHRLRF